MIVQQNVSLEEEKSYIKSINATGKMIVVIDNLQQLNLSIQDLNSSNIDIYV